MISVKEGQIGLLIAPDALGEIKRKPAEHTTLKPSLLFILLGVLRILWATKWATSTLGYISW